MEFKDYIDRHIKKFQVIQHIFEKDTAEVIFDKLNTEKESESELIYFKDSKSEEPVVFVFGFMFFLKELGEQEFKKYLGQNVLNFKIYKAYHDLKKKQSKIKISDILNEIQNKRKDSVEVHRILRRIMSMAYYMGWDLVRDKKDLEEDYIIEIPEKFLFKVKQRYNFDLLTPVYENEELCVFLDSKAKINVVFKDLVKFSKEDLEFKLLPILKIIFNLKEIKISEE